MSNDGAYGRRICERFRLEPRDGLVVRRLNKVSFAATRLTSTERNHGRTLRIPPEDSHALVFMLRPKEISVSTRQRAHERQILKMRCPNKLARIKDWILGTRSSANGLP